MCERRKLDVTIIVHTPFCKRLNKAKTYCQNTPDVILASIRLSIYGKVKSASKNLSTFNMLLGCIAENSARICRFTVQKNVHDTTSSTKIALYTNEYWMK